MNVYTIRNAAGHEYNEFYEDFFFADGTVYTDAVRAEAVCGYVVANVDPSASVLTYNLK